MINLGISYLENAVEKEPEGGFWEMVLENVKSKEAPKPEASKKEKANWIGKKMNATFEGGYLLRNSNVFAKDLTEVIVLMTHGLFWIPGHDMTASLQLFAQQGFKGWHEWNPKKNIFSQIYMRVTAIFGE